MAGTRHVKCTCSLGWGGELLPGAVYFLWEGGQAGPTSLWLVQARGVQWAGQSARVGELIGPLITPDINVRGYFDPNNFRRPFCEEVKELLPEFDIGHWARLPCPASRPPPSGSPICT